MDIDWSSIFDIIKSVSIILASWVAVYGINSWRRETKWKRKFEVAEEALAIFYEVQEKISIIRSPFYQAEEGKSREKSKFEENSEILDHSFVPFERYEKNKEPFYRLQAIKYRFMALFGKESEVLFREVVILVNRILSASQAIARNKLRTDGNFQNMNRKQTDSYLDEQEEHKSIVYENYPGKDDEILKEINKIISQIEEVCSKVLENK